MPLWCAVILIILANGTFVLMEFALVRVRASRVELLARRGHARAVAAQEILAHLDIYLAAIQVGITLMGLALGWIGEPELAAWVGRHCEWVPAEFRHVAAYGMALAFLAWLHIVFGELIPRTIGIQKAELVSLWGAYPLKIFTLILRLPIRFMAFSTRPFLRILGFKPVSETESVVSEEEMRVLLGETQEKGSLPLERLLLLENLFDLAAAHVSEAMVARHKVVFLSLNKSWEENLSVIRGRRFSRYPLCEDGLDSVIGMVHIKDLILRDSNPPDLRKLRRDLTEVKENEPLERLLKTFPDKGIHMALVRDLQGKISGILTWEDIVEELVGEVQDEFDLPSAWSLMNVVVPEAVSIQMQAADPREAIQKLLAKLSAAHPDIFSASEAFTAVWEREQKLASAVGRGVAIPHGRLPNISRPLVALGRFAKPVPFRSPDNVPVRMIFLILTPMSVPILQLKVLGRIASLISNDNLRRKLLRAKSSEALLETLRAADTILAG